MRAALDAVARWTIRSPWRAIASAVVPAAVLASLLPATTVDLTFMGVMNRANEHIGRYFEAAESYELGGLLLVLLEGEEEALDDAVERTIEAAAGLPSVVSARRPLPVEWLQEQAPWLVDRSLFEQWLGLVERPEDMANAARFAASAFALQREAAGVPGARLVEVEMALDPLEEEVGGSAFFELEDVVAEALAGTGVTAGFSGLPAISAGDQEQTLGAIKRLTPISLALVLLLFRIVEKRPGGLLSVAAVLVLSIGAALGGVGLLTGKLTIMETFFGVTVFGLGIDFAVHLFVRQREELARGLSFEDALRRTVRGAGSGVVAGCITTAGAFLVAASAPDPVALHLGLAGGLGLLFCLPLTLLILPSVWVLRERRRGRRAVPATVGATGAARTGGGDQGRNRERRSERDVGASGAAETGGRDQGRNWNHLAGRGAGAPGAAEPGGRDQDGNRRHRSEHGDETEAGGSRRRRNRKRRAERGVGVKPIRVPGLEALVRWATERPARCLLAGAAALAVSLAGLPRLQVETRLERIMNRGVPALAVVDRIQEILGTNGAPWILAAESLDQSREFARRLDGHPLFSEVLSLGALLPADLDERAATLARVLASEGDGGSGQQRRVLPQAALAGAPASGSEARGGGAPGQARGRAGPAGGVRSQAVEALRRATAAGPPDVDSLPSTLREKFIAPGGEFLVYAYPADSKADGDLARRQRLAVQAIDPSATGLLAVAEGMMIGQRPWIPWIAVSILAFVLVVLCVDFRRPALVLLALVPVLAAVPFTLGVLCWLGISFNVMTWLVLPLIFGLGIDDGIHVVHRILDEPSPRRTSAAAQPLQQLRADRAESIRFAALSVGRAIAMTTLTTTASFSVLLFTDHMGLETMAAVMLIGLPACLLASVTVLPAAAVFLLGKAGYVTRAPERRW